MSVYDEDVQTALEMITDFGGPINLLTLDAEADPTDPLRPWRGSGAPPLKVPHVAVVIPYEGAAAVSRPWAQQALMPGAGLTGDITKEMLFEDANGTVWQIKDCQKLAPDMVTVILWDCEVVQWPQRL
jgi:hypothetical protein